MNRPRRLLAVLMLSAMVVLLFDVKIGVAGGFLRRRAAKASPATVTVENPANAVAPSPNLGSMWPNRMVYIGGTNPAGYGYSPGGQYGVNTLSVYGPLSIYRATTAPVKIYSRGYDGTLYETEADSFSTPYYPAGSPVVYPTPNSYYYRPRSDTLPSQIPSPINWLDQN